MTWHLAQINVATARYDLEDEGMSGFMRRLDAVNALAEESPGFVWRLQSDSGNATDVDVGRGPRFIVNLTVWESIEALFEFVYKTAHRDVMIRRREWFERPDGRYQALWWIPAGHVPTPQEGMERLEQLRAHGPGPAAFDFRSGFPPPDEEGPSSDLEPEPWCSGWD